MMSKDTNKFRKQMEAKKENGIVWYTEEFLEREKQLAFDAGFSKGIRLEFHSVTPALEGRTIQDVKNELREFIKKPR